MTARRDPRLGVARCIVFCALAQRANERTPAPHLAEAAITDACAAARRALSAMNEAGMSPIPTDMAKLLHPKAPISDEWYDPAWHLEQALRCVDAANSELPTTWATTVYTAAEKVTQAPEQDASQVPLFAAACAADHECTPPSAHKKRFCEHAAAAVRLARGDEAKVAAFHGLQQATSRRLAPSAARLALRYLRRVGDLEQRDNDVEVVVAATLGMGAWGAHALVRADATDREADAMRLDFLAAWQFCATHATNDWYLTALDAMR